MLTITLFLGSALVKLEITDDKCGTREKKKAPGNPPNLRILNRYSDGVAITWDEPDPGTKPVEYYLVGMRDANSKWKKVAKIPPETRSIDLTDLIPNTKYQFRVRAKSELGVSAFSQLNYVTRITRRVGPDGKELDEDTRNDTVVNETPSKKALDNETLNKESLSNEWLKRRAMNNTDSGEEMDEELDEELDEEAMYRPPEGGFINSFERQCPEEHREYPNVYCFLVYLVSYYKGVKEEIIPMDEVDEAIDFLLREEAISIDMAQAFHNTILPFEPSHYYH